MDPRVALLKDFSKSFITGKAKIETEQFGFAFLEQLLSEGGTLEYGELTDTRLLHKYKIVDISERRMDELIELHILKQLNVCRYFGRESNDVICFNMDNNHKTDNTAIIPEMSLALDTLRTCLLDVGCEPLVVASGRGYHLWLRLDEPMENTLLYGFMVAAAARALLPLVVRGDDHRAVKFSFYPDINVIDAVSLRLFGTEHAKNKTFSHILTPDGLLDEDDSWKHFERFIRDKATSAATLRAGLDKLR
jgi:hypothetical protein